MSGCDKMPITGTLWDFAMTHRNSVSTMMIHDLTCVYTNRGLYSLGTAESGFEFKSMIRFM